MISALHDERGKNRAKHRAGAGRTAAHNSIFSHGAKEERACRKTPWFCQQWLSLFAMRSACTNTPMRRLVA
ncbi:MAG TPA: hypothetical protein VNN62_03095, partial [Methylomirabilota bacterium]|nr:hypothetical protein [Methylomirabilota bacterium]